MSDEIALRHATPGDPHRRDFLFVATGAVGAVAVGAAVWPLIDALNPSADVQSLSTIEVDLSGVEVGQRITVKWRGRPVFIWRRSAADIAEARATPPDDLVDPVDRASENPNHTGDMPALDRNRSVDEAGEWLVVIGVCTHLGCVPLGQGGQSVGDWGGWFCPCHGSHYDRSGRIRRGPAPRNLDIPPSTFIGDLLLRIG
ncbi:MAG: ubiquinol-cytochrome c reductase iron-sulfur subunit [Thermohalobaculum sp.]|nr:ubiquinol-cytochrome c reductase iron-sulfur subunit [Thermohalobaculum sp.]